MPTAKLWTARRSGARNVAGVTYQVLVTSHLLVEARAGRLPIRTVIPEGLEDIDCQTTGNMPSGLFVQAKERADRLGLADVAEAVQHALEAEPTGSGAVGIVTNADLAGGLAFSGWEKGLKAVLAESSIARLTGALPLEPGRARELLRRTHLVQVPFTKIATLGPAIAAACDCPAIVGHMAAGAVFADIAEVAAAQRATRLETAIRRSPEAIDQVVAEILKVVDVGLLEEAVRVGVIEILDFANPSSANASEFLRGLDVEPEHIAAGLDLERAEDVDRIAEGLKDEGYVLLVGPSGAGKSSLLWRTAYDLQPRMRSVRVRTLRPEHAPALLRFVEAQVPSEDNPLLIVADNLGRPQTAGWIEAAAQLLRKPGVRLLGASRSEDFDLSLTLRRAVLHRPILSAELAQAVMARLRESGLASKLALEEARARSKGLLMEFMSLAITGQRLEDVVGEQADALLRDPARAVQREAARYICAADVAGLDLPAKLLQDLTEAGVDLPSALARLKDEHIVVEGASGMWSGLHELRSTAIHRHLHAVPPPTEVETFARVLQGLSGPDQPAALLAMARRLPTAQVSALAGTAGVLLSAANTAVSAGLLSALAEIDALVHAAQCMSAARPFLRGGVDLPSLMLLLVPWRFGGVASIGQLPGMEALQPAVAALPEAPRHRQDAVASAGVQALVDRITPGDCTGAGQLARFLAGAATLTVDQVGALLTAVGDVDALDRGGLGTDLWPLLDDHQVLLNWLGPIGDRLARLGELDESVLSWSSSTEVDGAVVGVAILQPTNGDAESRAVEMARRVAVACPEAHIVEVRTLAFDGQPFTVAGYGEPGHKRIDRTLLVSSPGHIHIQRILRWVDRLERADSLTQRLRLQVEAFRALERLLRDAPRLLLDPRAIVRGGRWRDDVRAYCLLAAELPKYPREEAAEAILSLERSTQDLSSDPAKKALDYSGQALRQLSAAPGTASADRSARRGAAAQLREAAGALLEAEQAGSPRLTDVGDPLPPSTRQLLELVADIAEVVADDTNRAVLAQKPTEVSWIDLGRQIVAKATKAQVDEEYARIEQALANSGVGASVIKIAAEAFGSAFATKRLVRTGWVVVVAMEDWDGGSFWVQIDRQARMQLAFRTALVVEKNGQLLPLGALKLGTDWPYLLSQKEIQNLGAALQKEVMSSQSLDTVQSALNRLVEISAAFGTDNLRRARGLIGTIDKQALVDEISALVESMDKAVPRTASAFSAVAEYVSGESLDQERQGLAAIVAGALRSGPDHEVLNRMGALAWSALLGEPSTENTTKQV